MAASDRPAPRRAVERKRRRWIVWLVGGCLVLAGAGVVVAQIEGLIDIPGFPVLSSSPPPTPPSSPATVTPVSTSAPAPPIPVPQWPLTGVQDDVADRPALIVAMDNAAEARPQAGLAAADLVFELLGGDGQTQLAAVFHSRLPSDLAPIRDLGPYDQSISNWSRGLIVVSGQSWDSTSAGNNLQIISQARDPEGFSVAQERESGYDIVADPAVLLTRADAGHTGAPPAFCLFDNQGQGSTAQLQGEMTTDINIRLSSDAEPSWKWDPAKSVWLRYEAGQPGLDASKAQLSAANVLILEVELTKASEPTSLIGRGAGLVASGQMSAPITWEKPADGSQWLFFDQTGEPVTLQPGSTWVELVPKKKGAWSVS